MNTETLATEILHELKIQSKRYFIMLIVAIIVLFASNLAWLYVWGTHRQITKSEYSIDGKDNANVFYNGEGEVKINGENSTE